MSKIEAMGSFAVPASFRTASTSRFTKRDLLVAAAIVAIAAAFVVIPLILDVGGISAALNGSEGQYP